jgi:hypothetical protein
VGAILKSRLVRWVLAPIAVLCALGWGYIQINYPICTFRYKLTAEVMTPEGLKTGSSVIEVSYSHNGDAGGGMTPKLQMIGEALYLDLGKGKNLFVLLSNRTPDNADIFDRSGHDYKEDNRSLNPFSLPLKAFGLVWDFSETRKLCTEFNELDGLKSFPAPFSNLPTLVTFKHLDDPNSIELVHPDRVEDTIGSGVRISKVVLEKTDTPVTKIIEATLSWLSARKLKDSNASWSKSDPLIDQLKYLSFKQPN